MDVLPSLGGSRVSEWIAWILVLAVVVGIPTLILLARLAGWGEFSPPP